MIRFIKDLLGISDLREEQKKLDLSEIKIGDYVVIDHWSSEDVAKVQIIKEEYWQVCVFPLRGGRRLDPKMFPLLDSDAKTIKPNQVIRIATNEEVIKVAKYYACVAKDLDK